jgi:superfamily II DNA helicase RecQ
MPFKIITVPITSPDAAESELNSFLSSHRVLSVERRWIEAGTNSLVCFVVEYFASRGGTTEPRSNGRANSARIDYREVLSPEDFAVFAKLRDVRKEIAAAESVPAYMVFTNEQLAQVVKTRAATKSDLAKISGLGDARLEKYADRLLATIPVAWNGKPVEVVKTGTAS